MVQHYCMPVAVNAIVHIAADDNAGVLIDLMTLDIYGMATHTLADRVAECGETI